MTFTVECKRRRGFTSVDAGHRYSGTTLGTLRDSVSVRVLDSDALKTAEDIQSEFHFVPMGQPIKES